MEDAKEPMRTKPYTVIKPRKGWQLFDFRELKRYRDLFYFLVIRDIKVRYKQTVLGGLWAVIQPLFMMIIFTIFFQISFSKQLPAHSW